MRIRAIINDIASLLRPIVASSPNYLRSIDGPAVAAAYPIAAVTVCERHSLRQKRVYSGDAGRELEILNTFQSLAEILCRKYMDEHGHTKFEEPEFHTHPDALPFDYVSDRTARHNYH